MKVKIEHIVFDCTCDDPDWTDYDAIETADFLASRYVDTEWDVEDEDDILNVISDKSGWCINEIETSIIAN